MIRRAADGYWLEVEPPPPEERRRAARERLRSLIPFEQQLSLAEALARWRQVRAACAWAAPTALWQCVDLPRLLRVRCAGTDDVIIFDRRERELLSRADTRTAIEAFDWVPLE